MYWWADSTYTALREEDDERLCLRIIACVTGEHNKERVAVSNRFRESTDSGLDVLRDLKDRGLSLSPRLAVGDGAPGTFKAPLEQVYQETSPQRRWFYSMSNVLSALPKSLPSKAKADSKAISVAPTRKGAEAPFKRIVKRYGSKYPKATEKLLKDRDALLAFYTFAAEHWVHPRTTNPVESTFATAHYLTRRTKTCVTRSTFLGLAFKLAGTANEDGIPVNDDPPEERPGSTRAKRESAGHTPELTIASEFALRDPRKSLAPMKGT